MRSNQQHEEGLAGVVDVLIERQETRLHRFHFRNLRDGPQSDRQRALVVHFLRRNSVLHNIEGVVSDFGLMCEMPNLIRDAELEGRDMRSPQDSILRQPSSQVTKR